MPEPTQTVQPTQSVQAQPVQESKKGMGTGVKLLIGFGILSL